MANPQPARRQRAEALAMLLLLTLTGFAVSRGAGTALTVGGAATLHRCWTRSMHVRPGSVREATRAAVASICDVLARSDALVVGATVYRASRRNALGPPVALSASRVYPADTARLRIRAGRIEEGTIPDLGVIMRGGFQHGAGMGGPPPPPGEFLLVVVDRQSGTWVGEFITDGLAVLEAVLSEH